MHTILYNVNHFLREKSGSNFVNFEFFLGLQEHIPSTKCDSLHFGRLFGEDEMADHGQPFWGKGHSGRESKQRNRAGHQTHGVKRPMCLCEAEKPILVNKIHGQRWGHVRATVEVPRCHSVELQQVPDGGKGMIPFPVKNGSDVASRLWSWSIAGSTHEDQESMRNSRAKGSREKETSVQLHVLKTGVLYIQQDY